MLQSHLTATYTQAALALWTTTTETHIDKYLSIFGDTHNFSFNEYSAFALFCFLVVGFIRVSKDMTVAALQREIGCDSLLPVTKSFCHLQVSLVISSKKDL